MAVFFETYIFCRKILAYISEISIVRELLKVCGTYRFLRGMNKMVDAATYNANLNDASNLALQDPGLNVSIQDRQVASDSMKTLNRIIGEAVEATDAAKDGVITRDETLAISKYIRDNNQAEWNAAHGDDGDDGSETGFHRIQNDGGTWQSNGNAFVDGTMDSIYHLGYTNDGTNFKNEDGDDNATIDEMTGFLNQALFGDFRDGLTNNTGGGDGGGGDAGAEAAATDTGAKEAAGTEEAAGSEKAEAGEKAETGGGISSDIMALLQKLLNGEELTDEEKAQLAGALQGYMKDGELDVDALRADLEAAGMDPEQIDGVIAGAEDLVASLDEASDGEFSEGTMTEEGIADMMSDTDVTDAFDALGLGDDTETDITEDELVAQEGYDRAMGIAA